MSNKLARLIISSLILFIVSIGSTQSGLASPGPYGAVFTSSSGACGGWYKDENQKVVCCYFSQRPTCDDFGFCWCSSLDDHCEKLCELDGTCNKKAPECTDDED